MKSFLLLFVALVFSFSLALGQAWTQSQFPSSCFSSFAFPNSSCASVVVDTNSITYKVPIGTAPSCQIGAGIRFTYTAPDNGQLIFSYSAKTYYSGSVSLNINGTPSFPSNISVSCSGQNYYQTLGQSYNISMRVGETYFVELSSDIMGGNCSATENFITINDISYIHSGTNWCGLGPVGNPYVMQKQVSTPNVWNIYANTSLTGNPIGKIANGDYVVALSGTPINDSIMEISVPDTVSLRSGFVKMGCNTNFIYRPTKGHIFINAASGLKPYKYSGDVSAPVSNTFMKKDATCSGGARCLIKLFYGQRYVVLDSAQKGSVWYYKVSLPEGLAEAKEGYIPKSQCTYIRPSATFTPPSVPRLAAGGINAEATSASFQWAGTGVQQVMYKLLKDTLVESNLTGTNPLIFENLSPNTTYKVILQGYNSSSPYPSCFSDPIYFTTQTSVPPTVVTFSYDPALNIQPAQMVEFTGDVTGQYANSNLTWQWEFDNVPFATQQKVVQKSFSLGTHWARVCFGSYCSARDTFKVGSGWPYVEIDSLRFYAETITNTAPGNYELSGPGMLVRKKGGAYDALRFDLSNNKIIRTDSLSKKVMIDSATAYVPFVKGKDRRLYEGKMNFLVSGKDLKYQWGLVEKLISKAPVFSKLNLPVLTTTALNDGAVISAGRIQLPDIVKKLSSPACDTFGVWDSSNNTVKDSVICATKTRVKASISGLSLRRNSIWLAAQIKMTDLKIATLRVRRLELDMDYQPREKLYGGLDIDFKMFGLRMNTLIVEKRLDSLGVAVILSPTAVPLGTTGLSFYEFRGSVSNLQGFDNLPLTVRAGVTLGPYAPVDLSAIANIKGDMAYKLGTSFELYVRMKLWVASASGSMLIQRHRLQLYAQVSLMNLIEGRIKAVVYKPNVGKTQFYGVAGLAIKMPHPNMIENKTIRLVMKGLYREGETLAEASVYACNAYVCGWAGLKLPKKIGWIRISGMLRWNNPGMSVSAGLGMSRITPQASAAIDSLWGRMRTSGTLDGMYKFDLATSTERLFIEATGTPGIIPQMSFVTPWGDSIHAGNIANYPNVVMVADTLEGFLAYIVNYPKIGDYGLVLSGVDTIEINRLNNLPSIYLNHVSHNVGAKEIQVQWSDADVDEDARVRLFLDTDKANADGVAFVEDMSEDNQTDAVNFSYGNVPTGDYYVGATIQDSSGYAYSTYYDTPIRIITDNAPNAPSLSSITFDDKNIYGNFTTNNVEGQSYTLYYSTTGTVSYNSPSVGISDSSANFAVGLTIKPGRTYSFAIAAMDTNYRESAMSNVISVNYVASVENNVPYFVPNQNIPKTVVAGSAYNYTLQAVDADNEPLQYALIEAPYGMTINSSTGAISWTPDANAAGMAWIEVAVIDGSKAYDSLYFEITILGTYTKDADLRFNKNLFVNVGDEAIVSLRDLDLGTNNFQKDVTSIRVYSESDMTGMTLSATETAPESREYAAFFTLGNTTGGGILQAALGDTIWAEYFDATINQTIRTVAYFVTLTADFEMALDSCGKVSSFNALCKGDNLRYSWNFGDGSTGTGRKPKHIYSHAGPFTVTITATDPDGRSASASKVISIDCITLPTEIALTGATVSEGNLLTWEVAADDQTQSFHIERAKKGEDFAEIAAVAHTQSRQTWLDKDLQATTYSYRLRLVDVNGNGTYSNQIELSRAASATVRCYPNPVQATLNLAIESLSETPASIKIYDMKGSLVLETGADLSLGSNKVELPVTELQAGAYQVQIITDSESIMTQFVKE